MAINITIPYNYDPRPYQLPFLKSMDSGTTRACWICHRRSGKTKTMVNFAAKKAVQRVGTIFHCFPEYAQGRKVLWDGIGGDGFKFTDHFPKQIVKKRNDQEMKLTLSNNSIYQIIGADNYDSVVGSNPVGLILDEWAISDRYPVAWDYFRPILAENGGWAVFTYTPRGMNHGYTLYEMAKHNPEWFCEVLTVDNTGVISQEAIQAERDAGMSDAMIEQEFYCSFTVVGLRPFEFSRLHHVIEPMPIPDNAPVYMTFDWGFGAPFSVCWLWVDNDGRLYQFAEWYGWNGMPNKGLRLEDSAIATGILERERGFDLGKRPIIRLAGPDCFQKKPDYRGGGQGPSTAETFARHGLYLSPGDPSRELKLRQFRERLRIPRDDDGKQTGLPMLVIYSSCEQTIRTLPVLSIDPKRVEDVDTSGEDHIFDSLAHAVMSRPITPTIPKVPPNLADVRINMIEGAYRSYEERIIEEIHRERAIYDNDDSIFAGEDEFRERFYVRPTIV